MYLEPLSRAYWITEVDFVPWGEDRVAMATEDHEAVAEFVYGCDNHPLLVKYEGSSGHKPVYPEKGLPAETIAIPSEDGIGFDRWSDYMLVANRTHAKRLFSWARQFES